MLQRAIGEKVTSAYRVFVVALPENNDEYIKVSGYAPLCFSGTMYYEGNKAEDFDAFATEKALLTADWAKIHIPGYRDGMKLVIAEAFCNHWYAFDDAKANEKLRDKLSGLTRWEFYNNKW